MNQPIGIARQTGPLDHGACGRRLLSPRHAIR